MTQSYRAFKMAASCHVKDALSAMTMHLSSLGSTVKNWKEQSVQFVKMENRKVQEKCREGRK